MYKPARGTKKQVFRCGDNYLATRSVKASQSPQRRNC